MNAVGHHCPQHAQRQRSWLSIVAKAYESGNEDFAVWAAIHWKSLREEPHSHQIREVVTDLNDWVKACAIEQASRSIEADDIEKIHKAMLSTRSAEAAESLHTWWQGMSGAAEAGRPFNKEMSPQTVLRLSEEWHERAAVTKAADVEFPEPWLESGEVGDYHIEPIKTAPELSRIAYRLHNCATSYAHQIAGGYCFLYVVIEGDAPKAMVELSWNGKHAELSQLKGPCNEGVSEELTMAVNTWFDAA